MRLAAAIVSLAVVACHTSPVVLETGLAGATTLAVDSNSIYWIEIGPPISPPTGAQVLLRRATLNGGPPQTIAAGIAGSRDLRLVDGQLYFSGFLDGQIFALPVSGGAPRAVVAPLAGEKLSAWAVQGSDVFTITADATTYHLRRSPLAGGGSVELLSGAYFRDPFSGPYPPRQLAVTPDAIFLADYANLDARLVSRLLRRPRGDDPALPLTTVHTALTIANLRADGQDLFWTEESLQTFRQTVAALSLSSGTPRVLFELPDRGDLLLAAPDGSGHVLAVDWTSGSDFYAPKYTVRRIDSTGGGRELFDQEESIDALAALQGHAWYISDHSEIRLAF